MANSEIRAYTKFDDMPGIPPDILRGIYGSGFETPSAPQEKGIVPVIEGHDTITQAQSGTGKTGTFSIGSACRVDVANPHTQVLVIAPTRELAQQIEGVYKGIIEYTKITVHGATGGMPVRDDISALQRGAQVVIGTPGRIYDLMERKILKRDHIKNLIMDEADQLLEGRFRDQMEEILNLGFPSTTRVNLFSATMSPEIIEVAERLLKDPVRILLPPEKVTLEGIKQFYVEIEQEAWKFDCLTDLYQHIDVNQALIYCNTRQRVETLTKRLQENGFGVSGIHGEMDPKERRACITAFRSGAIRVLISSDLLARGLDVQQISLVINYELPQERANYIHRIGRSGRFGKKGTAINLVTASERLELIEIEKYYSTQIVPLTNNLGELLRS